MRKFFRKLFSPTVLIILILLLELILIGIGYFGIDLLFTALGVDEGWGTLVYLAFKFIVGVLEFVMFFVILNKDEDPEWYGTDVRRQSNGKHTSERR